jgi:hypothetical protein
MNDTLLWLMGLPIAIGVGLWVVLRGKFDNAWMPGLVNGVVGALILCAVFYGSKGVATSDTEIWNGMITAKARDHGSYQKPYDCNCRTVTSGSGKNQTTSRVCDTCYEDHYTVNWNCKSTVGGWTIDSADWTNRGVYALPNPQRWSSINIGDPAAKQHGYTNYVQAVPESLFKPSSESLRAKFAGITPKYPDGVYDFYRNDHFLSPGYTTPDAAAWNLDLANMLRELGPKKQVNAIVVVAKTADPNYEYALRDAWEGANKNDVVVVIGSAEWPKIDFVRVISWTKNELFKVQLRDSIQELGMIQRAPILSALQEQIGKNFERRHMAEFKYLETEIDPPTWLMITTVIVLLLGGVGTWIALTGQFSKRPQSRYTRSMGPR